MADILELLKSLKISEEKSGGKPEYMIVGLGNPGDKYTFTRHNAGFLAMDYISEKCGVKVNKLKFKSLCGTTVIAGHSVLLMKPQTFMNSSGTAVKEAMDFYDIPIENVIVLVDDICLAPGRVRFRKSGAHGGHNGLKSIIVDHVKSDNFPRVRIGVGEKPNPEYDLADWVLGRIPKEDEEKMFSVFGLIYDTLPLILDKKYDDVMGKLNGARF